MVWVRLMDAIKSNKFSSETKIALKNTCSIVIRKTEKIPRLKTQSNETR